MSSEEQISPSRIGRLFWVIGLSLLGFFMLAWLYMQRSGEDSAVTRSTVGAPLSDQIDGGKLSDGQIRSADDYDEDGVFIDTEELEYDPEDLPIPDVEPRENPLCSMGDCTNVSLGVVTGVAGNAITFTQSNVSEEGEFYATEPTFTIPADVSVQYFDEQQEGFVNSSDPIKIDDVVRFTGTEGTARTAIVLVK